MTTFWIYKNSFRADYDCNKFSQENMRGHMSGLSRSLGFSSRTLVKTTFNLFFGLNKLFSQCQNEDFK